MVGLYTVDFAVTYDQESIKPNFEYRRQQKTFIYPSADQQKKLTSGTKLKGLLCNLSCLGVSEPSYL
ncbi:MAG: hypothetical protein F6K21_21535 [Symploca sp. SIO2D2]|nr:hypothetical protein [Symploca sp. SIO2D2]